MINTTFCTEPQPTFIEWCIEVKTSTNVFIRVSNSTKQWTHTNQKGWVILYGFGADPDSVRLL